VYEGSPCHVSRLKLSTTSLAIQPAQKIIKPTQLEKLIAIKANQSSRTDFAPFLPCDAMLAQYMLLPCVCPSQVIVLSKRLNKGSCKQCHTIEGLFFLTPKILDKLEWSQPNGGDKCRWGMLKSAVFEQYLAISPKQCRIRTQSTLED